MEDIQKALGNESNEDIISLNKDKIELDKNHILSLFGKRKFLTKLKEYRYIEYITNVHYGKYIRWINKEGVLVNGGNVCSIDETHNTITVKKGFRFFTCYFTHSVVFQKISYQEGLLLEIANILNKDNNNNE